MTVFCCNEMNQSIHEMGAVRYVDKFDEYLLPVAEDGVSFLQLRFCPFCGQRLPESKRDEWFDRLERLGFDEPADQDIPSEYKSAKWWKNAAGE